MTIEVSGQPSALNQVNRCLNTACIVPDALPRSWHTVPVTAIGTEARQSRTVRARIDGLPRALPSASKPQQVFVEVGVVRSVTSATVVQGRR